MEERKGQTLLKMKNDLGETFYVDSVTGEEVKLKRVEGKHRNYIPNSVYGRFRVPYINQILKKYGNQSTVKSI